MSKEADKAVSSYEKLIDFGKIYEVDTEEDYKAAEKEYSVKSEKAPKNKSGRVVRSLHHIDDDDEDVAPAPQKKEKLIEVEVRPEDAPVMKEDKGVKYEKK